MGRCTARHRSVRLSPVLIHADDDCGDLAMPMKMKYLVVIEQGPSSFGAYVPDLPGCIAVGDSRAEVSKLIHEAIAFHLEGMQEDGIPIPLPHSSSELIEVHA